MLKAFKIVSLLIVCAAAVYFVLTSQEPLDAYQTQPMPPIVLDGLDGNEVSTGSWALIEDGPKVINLFASWCAPCIAELPVLEQLNDHVPVYGIAFKDSPEELKAWLKEHGNPYKEIGIDKGLTFMWDLGITAVPTTILFDASQKMVYVHQGAVTEAVMNQQFLPRLKRLEHAK